MIPISQAFSRSLEELIARRVEFLAGYQDAAYAERYRKLVERARGIEAQKSGGSALTEAVARYYFKLLAYKDEYEVARLYTDPAFTRKIEGMFEGGYKLKFHLAPPALNRPDPRTGEASKSEFGPWMMTAFRVLAKLKGLRGSPLDIFGWSEERKTERRLIADYEATMASVIAALDGQNHAMAVQIAGLPEQIRGFGHVKEKNLAKVKEREANLLAAFRSPAGAATAAE